MATRQEQWPSRAATRSLRLRVSVAVFTVGVLGMVAVTKLPTATDLMSNSSPLNGAADSAWSLRGGLRRLHATNATSDLGTCPWKSPKKDTLNTCTDDDNEACCGEGGYPDDDGADDDGSTGGGGAGKLIYSLLLLFYMFLGIAILCDELFVPALEIIADKWELSNDVAGATLMAAGGSAPELFTSLFGAFGRSEVGFSTIVGSAVFNVLFVIGMCAMFTPAKYSPLKLTWWPLARDCSYYILTLLMLVVWMSDGKVDLYEALLQFLLYAGYVLLMAKSEKLEAKVKEYLARSAKVAQSPVGSDDKHVSAAVEDARYEPTAGRPSTFRASVLQMMTNKGTTAEATGVALVTRIKGDVNEVFDKLDENSNGQLDKSELKELLRALGVDERELTDESLNKMRTEINGGPEGDVISKEQFTVWYAKSETRLMSEMKTCFDKIDTNHSGTIEKDEIRALLAELGHSVSDREVDDVERAIAHNPETGQITFADFRGWYSSSLLFDQKREQADAAVEAIESMWSGVLQGLQELQTPDMPVGAKISFILTLPLTLLCCLVPDCRPPGKEGYCYLTFVGSIIGIGGFSYIMVEMATNVGNVLRIPVYIMGITIIAAGTSVPDLLSSVIVAKQGHGDMAVSSSVGSNIFDVTVGIPLPWILFSIYTAVYDCTYGNLVNEADLLLPTCILLIMVFVIVVTIAACNWEMTHGLGTLMFAFYVGYLLFAILQEYCFHVELSF